MKTFLLTISLVLALVIHSGCVSQSLPTTTAEIMPPYTGQDAVTLDFTRKAAFSMNSSWSSVFCRFVDGKAPSETGAVEKLSCAPGSHVINVLVTVVTVVRVPDIGEEITLATEPRHTYNFRSEQGDHGWDLVVRDTTANQEVKRLRVWPR